VKKKLLPILAVIALVLIAKADKLSEIGEIWPTLTAIEKVIVILVFILGAAVFFGIGWAIQLGWAAMRRGLSQRRAAK
jgi:hypothetical protein